MSQQQEQVNDPNGGDNGRDGDGGGDGNPIEIQPPRPQSKWSSIKQTVHETIRLEWLTTLRTLFCDCLTCDSTCCCTKNEDDIKTPEDRSNNREDSTTDQQRPRMSAARANLYKNTESPVTESIPLSVLKDPPATNIEVHSGERSRTIKDESKDRFLSRPTTAPPPPPTVKVSVELTTSPSKEKSSDGAQPKDETVDKVDKTVETASDDDGQGTVTDGLTSESAKLASSSPKSESSVKTVKSSNDDDSNDDDKSQDGTTTTILDSEM